MGGGMYGSTHELHSFYGLHFLVVLASSWRSPFFPISVNVDTKQVGNVSDIRLVVESIMMGALHGNEELTDGLGCQLAGLAFGEGEHGSLHEVELLLEVIEADACVDLVPVQNLSLIGYLGIGPVCNSLEATIHILIVQDIEKLLEEEPVAEVHGEVLDLPATAHGEDFVQEDAQIMRLL